MRLLVYSQDGMGLGHLRRTRNIAREILARQPEARILTIADSPVAPFFSPLPGMDYLKLHTIVKTGPADWRTEPPMHVQDALRLRSELILTAYRDFDPDAVLVDHMPVGALGELKPLLERVAGQANRPRLFLGLRDILDSPETIRDVWRDLGAYPYLERYDAVLIYGCRDVFDAASAYGLTAHARSVTFCDYVAARPGPDAAAYPLEHPFILVMGGGGADAFPLAKAFMDAVPILLQSISLRALVLTGPNMPVSEREVLQAQSGRYPVKVEASVADATAWLQGASAVVTMGGYNSLCEVLQARTKALVVPRRAPSAEQRMRSELFAQRQLLRMLDPDALTPQILAEALLELLYDDGVPHEDNMPPLDGAERAADLLVGGLRASGEGALAGELVGGS